MVGRAIIDQRLIGRTVSIHCLKILEVNDVALALCYFTVVSITSCRGCLSALAPPAGQLVPRGLRVPRDKFLVCQRLHQAQPLRTIRHKPQQASPLLDVFKCG